MRVCESRNRFHNCFVMEEKVRVNNMVYVCWVHNLGPEPIKPYCVAPGCVGKRGGTLCGICPSKTGQSWFDANRGVINETPSLREASESLEGSRMSADSVESARVLSFSAM